jgi:hypothetical protein
MGVPLRLDDTALRALDVIVLLTTHAVTRTLGLRARARHAAE